MTRMPTAQIVIRYCAAPPKQFRQLVGIVSGVREQDIADILTAHSQQTSSGGTHGYRQARQTHRYYEPGQRSEFYVAVGLVPRLVDQLQRRGWRVNVSDEVPPGPVSPRQGQVIVQNNEEALEALRDIRVMYAGQPVLVVARTTREEKWLHHTLRKTMEGIVTRDPDKAWESRHRTLFVNPGLFSCINPADWDVVVLWGADYILNAAIQEGTERCREACLWHVAPPAMYCIHRGETRSQREQLAVEQACGPVIYDTRPATHEIPATVHILSYLAPGPAMQPAASVLERKRSRIWHNEPRNQRVADVAIAVAESNRQEMAALGLAATAASGSIAI
ncbi:MAG: hypothetical protein ACYC4U_25070, partial [Pirellulaceae bacterium]